MKKKDIQEFVEMLTSEADAKGETKKLAEVIEKKLQEFIDVFTEFEMDLPEALHRILDSKKLNLPKSFDVKVTNAKDLSPVFNAPKEIEIKRSAWMDELKKTMDAVRQGLDELKKKEMTLPKKAKDAIAVRLSDGEEFYKAITEVYQTAMAPGGGGNVPKLVVTGGVQAVPIVNPDGSNVGGSGGTSAADGSAYTPGSTTGTALQAARDDSGTTTLAEDKVGIVRATEYRAMHVNLRDASGNEVSVGGGTQYTEDAAAAADPVGNMIMAVRADSLAAVTSTNGDNIALRSTNKGELYTKSTDSDALLTTIDADTSTIAGAVSGSEMQVDIVGSLPAGTNAIGKLAANSGVDIGDVDVASLPALAAGTNLIGKVSASDETSTIYNGTTALTPKFAIIDASTSGDNTLVASVSSKKIRVHALYMVAAGDVNARFESGAGGTALSGQMNLTTNSGFVLPYNPVGWFETAVTTLLNLELSAAVSVDGSLVYTEV